MLWLVAFPQYSGTMHPQRSDWVCGVLDRWQFGAICNLLTAMCCFIQTLQMFLRYDKLYISVMIISRQQENEVPKRRIYTRAIPKSTSDLLVKKHKIEDKTLLYGTVTYITALLLRIVAIHI
jgi:hypothetical protein